MLGHAGVIVTVALSHTKTQIERESEGVSERKRDEFRFFRITTVVGGGSDFLVLAESGV